MGKHALLLTVILAAAGGYTQLNLSQSHQAETMSRTGHQLEVVARDAALSGYAEATHALEAEDLALLESRSGVVVGGRYETSFDVDLGVPTTVRIRVEGFADSVGTKSARHVIEALFRDADGLDVPTNPDTLLSRVPPYLRYAAISNGPLRFVLLPRILGASAAVNANVHTNSNMNIALSLQGALGLQAVRGFGTYSGHLLNINLLSNPANSFRPPRNPDLHPTLRRTGRVEMPRLPIDSLAQFATQRRVGGLDILGRTSLGTREDPEIIHVQGDLGLVDTNFEGYGIYLVEGSLICDATVTGVLATLLNRPESRVAFYVDGPILFNGVGDVQGQFVSNSSVTFSGAATLYGNVSSRGAVNFIAAPTIRFLPPSPALTIDLPDNPPVSEMELVARREWEG